VADEPEDEDALEKIEKLGELRDKGLISPEEFEAQKQKLPREV
jgi:Short C-terminal domain